MSKINSVNNLNILITVGKTSFAFYKKHVAEATQ